MRLFKYLTFFAYFDGANSELPDYDPNHPAILQVPPYSVPSKGVDCEWVEYPNWVLKHLTVYVNYHPQPKFKLSDLDAVKKRCMDLGQGCMGINVNLKDTSEGVMSEGVWIPHSPTITMNYYGERNLAYEILPDDAEYGNYKSIVKVCKKDSVSGCNAYWQSVYGDTCKIYEERKYCTPESGVDYSNNPYAWSQDPIHRDESNDTYSVCPQCGCGYEKPLPLPRCDTTSTKFGNVNFNRDRHFTLKPSDPRNTIKSKASENDCAAACYNTAGCYDFYYSPSDGCRYVVGEKGFSSIRYEDGKEVGADTSVTINGRQSTLCPENPFSEKFTKKSSVHAKYMAPWDAQKLIKKILEENLGKNSKLNLNEWTFSTEKNPSFSSKSVFVNLEESVLNQGEGAFDRKYTTILFEIKTHVRKQQSSRRKRSSDFLADLADMNTVDADIIQSLKNDLKIPSGAEFVGITKVVQTIEALSSDGEVAGSCKNGSCSCAKGFVKQNDGSCSLDLSATNDLANLNSEVSDLINESFAQDERYKKRVLTPLGRLTKRLLANYERHSCEPKTTKQGGRRKRSIDLTTIDRSVCGKIYKRLEEMVSWAEDEVERCGNEEKRDKRVTGITKKLNKLKNGVDLSCGNRLNKIAISG